MRRLAIVAFAIGCSGSSAAAPETDAAIVDARIDATPEAEVAPATCPSAPPTEGQPCNVRDCVYACGDCREIRATCVDGRWTDTACVPSRDKACAKPCATDEDCDVTGEAINKCSTSLPVPAFPTPECVSPCDPGDGTKLLYCDGDNGVCTSVLGAPSCVPLCQFKDDGAAPLGCDGKNGCNFLAHRRDATTGELVAVGYCLGGCRVDADCRAPTVCQSETSWCVRTRATYTKSLGDACTSDSECACFNNTSGGYCTRACRVGESCPSGYTCDPALPTEFTKLPVGLLGRCLKDCTSDADCVNSKCQQNGGLDHKTCTVTP